MRSGPSAGGMTKSALTSPTLLHPSNAMPNSSSPRSSSTARECVRVCGWVGGCRGGLCEEANQAVWEQIPPLVTLCRQPPAQRAAPRRTSLLHPLLPAERQRPKQRAPYHDCACSQRQAL